MTVKYYYICIIWDILLASKLDIHHLQAVPQRALSPFISSVEEQQREDEALGGRGAPVVWDKAGDSEAGEYKREGEWQTPGTRPSSLPSLWGTTVLLLCAPGVLGE